ncbi:MAG: DUF2508 family protein [bacterium]|nr:DUF2508 family protein [Bacillota bacterium]
MKPTPELLLHGDINLNIVREAKDDWQLAQAYFTWVVEPELVDFAIFWERAARLRYVYLLRCLRKDGYRMSRTEVIESVLRQG